jgi:hypothetical protein
VPLPPAAPSSPRAPRSPRPTSRRCAATRPPRSAGGRPRRTVTR